MDQADMCSIVFAVSILGYFWTETNWVFRSYNDDCGPFRNFISAVLIQQKTPVIVNRLINYDRRQEKRHETE